MFVTKIRAIVFDLDGTLIDGYEAIHEALCYAMTQLGFTPPTTLQTRQRVGHGLLSLMEESVGKALAPEAVRLYQNYYPEVVLQKTRLLPGVKETLRQLADSKVAISLASNKPAQYSRKILEANGIASYFAAIAGPDDTHPPKPDPTMLIGLMQEMKSTPADTLCVGDMEVDVQFARAAGCRVIVLPGGSRDRLFLEALNPDLVINDLLELPQALGFL